MVTIYSLDVFLTVHSLDVFLSQFGSGCKSCEGGKLTLCDRRDVRFPVIRRYPHRSLIVNSVPICMSDRADALSRANVLFEHFIFTVESSTEVDSVIDSYKKSISPSFSCRRIK